MNLKNIFILLTIFGVTHGFDLKRDIIDNLKECASACPKLLKGLVHKEPWAFKMLDAWSKLPSGLMMGNIIDFGNFDECIAIKEDVDVQYCGMSTIITIIGNDPRESKSLPVQYHRDMLSELNTFNITQQARDAKLTSFSLVLSVCLPTECNPTAFQKCTNDVLKPLNFINVQFNDDSCQNGDTPDIDKYDIVAIVIFSTILLCVILCTTYDVIIQKQGKKPHHLIFISFSVYTNGKKLIALTNNPDQISTLNGLRFISMLWVMAGHRYSSFQRVPSINAVAINEWKHEVYSQYIQSATLSVDTFLFLSGLVLSYTFLKSQRNPNSKFNLILYYVHRYLRITPAAGALFLFCISIWKYFATGPLISAIETQKDTCLEYWWSYFLYIQNYVNVDNLCLLHTWYLSVDIQMFLISPLILFPLLKFKKPAMYGLGILIIISIIIPFVIVYEYETQIFSKDYDKYYYYVTHTRLAPWLIGLALGVVILDTKDRPIKIRWQINLLTWALVLVGMGAIVFTGNDIINNMEVLKNAFYISLHRAAWTIGLCWIVFSSYKGYGGIIGWFLSWPMFQVLARLTYSMYLTHSVVIVTKVITMRQPIFVSDYETFYQFCGDLMVTLVCATIWTLLFESPIIIIEKILFGGALKKKPNKRPEEPADSVKTS